MVAIGLLAMACTRPGVRGAGTGTVELGGTFDLRWSGSCEYEVHTRWATSLQHVLTLSGEGHHLEIATRTGFAPGRYALVASDAGERRAMLVDGHTVRGAVDGWLEIAGGGDERVAIVSGQIAHRDRGPIRAECRWTEGAAGRAR